jgi:hypothetical protein
MSAFEGIANIAETPQNVRVWPIAEILIALANICFWGKADVGRI